MTANGLEKQPGIFISRLVPGGLAEGTGLLAVNDEVLEVNGIEVAGKSLDQVRNRRQNKINWRKRHANISSIIVYSTTYNQSANQLFINNFR